MTPWPELKYEQWADTAQTLHMWTQIAGKIRMAKSPPVNHWWHVTLYVTSRGVGTSPIPFEGGTFEVDFDFVDHRLRVSTTAGDHREFKLHAMTVADFYGRVTSALAELNIDVHINPTPNEVAEPIPFHLDTTHHSYDPDAVHRFWVALVNTCRVFTRFRARFLGKVSPVHLFWGGLDLAVTRFSGRDAPKHPGAPLVPLHVAQEAYSHEVSSAGFWPGGGGFEASYYAYLYPEPEGYAAARVKPAAAFYSNDLREFMLPYEAVRTSESPDDTLMDFLQSTYEAGADLAKWDRAALERPR